MDQALRKYIKDWDPMGLIENGYPDDEYDREALLLRMAYDKNKKMDSEQVGQLVYKIFTEELALDPQDFLKETQSRAKKVRFLLAETE